MSAKRDAINAAMQQDNELIQHQQQNGKKTKNSNRVDSFRNEVHNDLASKAMSGAQDDDVERMSAFGGTATSASADGPEEVSPLQTVIIDVMFKNDKAKGMYEGISNTISSATTPQDKKDLNISPADGDLFTSGQVSGTSHNHKTGLQSKIPQKNFAKYASEARKQEIFLFSQLDTKSARGLAICDPGNSLIVWVNEAAERIFGRLDLVGSNLESLMLPDIAVRHAGVVSAYRDRYKAEYRKTGTTCDSRLLDLVKTRRLAIVKRVSGRDEKIHIDAWVRSLRMIDEPLDDMPRLMALECYEAQQYHDDSATARIFRAALENVSDAIVVADFDGRIEYINKSAELLTGHPLSALRAVRASVNMLVPTEMITQHEGYLQHFRQNRRAAAATMNANSHEIVVQRRAEMKTAFGKEEILLRVEVAFDKLIGYLKSTREFIPREDFDNERLKLLLPASIVKLLRGATSVSDITSFFWEFEHKTVMFTDVAGFSNWARNRPVKAVHDRMQPMFGEFEAIVQAFGGELIHRIGDAIMVIFGFNGEERHHARYALACAVELQQWSLNNGFLVRIGLHSGSIGAGIYGSDKGRPSFDAWGPVVNIAKRLEAYGEEGNVHMSRQVRDALGHRFASQLLMILKENILSGIKGVEDGDRSFILTVKHPDSNQIALPEKFLQLVGFQKAKFARWRIANEETERRLAELQKAAR